MTERPSAPPATSLLHEGPWVFEAPDRVPLDVELAGPGSRFCAVCIDSTVVGCGTVGLVVLLSFAGVRLPSALQEASFLSHRGQRVIGWAVASVVGLFVLSELAYHALFERLMRGQTPGKRVMKIRAMSSDGAPLRLGQVLVRNVLRIVDFLPIGYGVGGALILLGSTSQRLGDLAAGTIVVKAGDVDRRAKRDAVRGAAPVELVVPGSAELSVEESRLVQGFLSRRSELLPAARVEVGEALALRLFRRHGGEWVSAESYLERLLLGRHRER